LSQIVQKRPKCRFQTPKVLHKYNKKGLFLHEQLFILMNSYSYSNS
jgi:hypothetical protein